MSDVHVLFERLIMQCEGKFICPLTKRDYAWRFGRFEATRIRDMCTPGFDSEHGVPELPVDETEMVTFYCDEVCCTLRPSGTEPKVKYYIEACS